MSNWQLQCNKCGRAMEQLKRCTRCYGVMYCSKLCQTKDWPTHKTNCNKYSKTNDLSNCGTSNYRTSNYRAFNCGTIPFKTSNCGTISCGTSNVGTISCGTTNFTTSTLANTPRRTPASEDLTKTYNRMSSNGEEADSKAAGRYGSNSIKAKTVPDHQEQSDIEAEAEVNDVVERGKDLDINATNDEDNAENDVLTFSTTTLEQGEQEVVNIRKPSTDKVAFDKSMVGKESVKAKTSTENDIVKQGHFGKINIGKMKDETDEHTDDTPKGLFQHCKALDCVLNCSRCKAAFYCSRNCQRKDWSKHKRTCERVYTEEEQRIIDQRIGADRAALEEYHRSLNDPTKIHICNFIGDPARVYEVLAPDKALVDEKPIPGSLDKALYIAASLCPHLPIVTLFDQVPLEPLFPWQELAFLARFRPTLLVAFINKYHVNVMNHSVHLLVMDSTGRESHVEFYLDAYFDSTARFPTLPMPN